MKTRIKILGCLLAVAAVSLTSCVNENFTPGDPDPEDCYKVYFPDQDTEYALDPDDDPSVTLTVARDTSASSEAISVPYSVVDTSYTGVFVFSGECIEFAEGEYETEISVSFADAEIGTTYACNLQISDPQYYSQYSSNPAGFDFTVCRDRWNDLGDCQFTDDYIPSLFGVDPLTYDVPVQENDLRPGLYRLEYPYDGKNAYNDSWETDPDDYAYGEADWDTSKTYWLEINAQNPSQVYIDLQPLGMTWSGYGMFYIYSMAKYYIDGGDPDSAKAYYGTLKNGVITFPTSALLAYMPEYDSSGYYYVNGNGAFKVVLPDALDFTITVTSGSNDASTGELPVYIECGEDVSYVKYQIYEGALSKASATDHATAIGNGTEEDVSEYDPQDGGIVVTFDETGVYTIVAVTFDESGEAQESDYTTLYYLAQGDTEHDVWSNVTCFPSGRQSGYTSATTLEFTVTGKDLVGASYYIFDEDTYEYYAYYGGIDYVVELVKEYGDSFDSDDLKVINSSTYSGIINYLTPGTDYELVVWVSNGYSEDYWVCPASTDDVEWDETPTYGDYAYSLYWSDYEVDDDGNYVYDDDGYPVEIPYIDEDLTLYGSSDPTYYKITDWGGGVDFTFFHDKSTGYVMVSDQYTGSDYYSAYPVYVDDYADYIGSDEPYSYYEGDTYEFALIYYCALGYFNYGYEEFTLTGDTPSATNVRTASVGGNGTGKTFNIRTNMAPVKMEKATLRGRVATRVETAETGAKAAFTVTKALSKASSTDSPAKKASKKISKNAKEFDPSTPAVR